MKRILYTWIILALASELSAQMEARTPTPEDYRRAASFQWQNLVNKKIFNVNIQPVWCGDSTGMGFVTQDRERKSFNKVVWGVTKIQAWFDQEKLAKALSDSTKQKVTASDLALQNINYKNSSHLEFHFQGKRYELNLLTHSLKILNPPASNPLESKSPDGKWIAFTKDYNLYIRSTADGSERQLSRDGKRLYEFGTFYGWSDIIEGENGRGPPVCLPAGPRIPNGSRPISAICGSPKKCTCWTGLWIPYSNPACFLITGAHPGIRTWCV